MLLRLQDELRERIGSRCVIFISKPYFLEIMPYNCGKGVSKEPIFPVKGKIIGSVDLVDDDRVADLKHQRIFQRFVVTLGI